MKQAGALSVIILILFSLVLAGCGGGGGGGDESPPPQTSVTIKGRVDDGTSASPIPNAVCRFEQQGSTVRIPTNANPAGEFTLLLDPDVEGFFLCHPPAFPKLTLSTFISTVGQVVGTEIPDKNVTPASTVVAESLRQFPAAVRRGREAQLLADIEAGEPNITTLIDVTTRLYKPLLTTQIDVEFAESAEGGNGGDDGGGADGEAGDGAEGSPIPGALCDFALSVDGAVLVHTVLGDLFDNGILDRPDLQPVVDQVDIPEPDAVTEAFNALFPLGIGRPISTTAADANSPTPGRYRLPIPVNVPGFVRCSPPDPGQENLRMSTCVRARSKNETIPDQDVDPATTIICDLLENVAIDDRDNRKTELLAAQSSLRIQLAEDGDSVARVSTEGGVPLTDENRDLALLVFASTTIFDTMRMQSATLPAEVTFLNALDDFFSDGDFESDLASLAPAVEGAIQDDENQAVLGTDDVVGARQRGTVQGIVATGGGQPLAGVQVEVIQDGVLVDVEGNPATTDANGAFRVENVPEGDTTVTASLGGGETSSLMTTVVAASSVTVTLTVQESANQAPVANAGPDQTVQLAVGQTAVTVMLNGSGSSDVDGTVVQFLWSGTPDPADVAQPTVTLGVGVHTFSLVVVDNDGAQSQVADTVMITVQEPANQAPVANAGADQQVSVGATVQLDGTGSSDPDGDALSYAWSFTQRPEGSNATLSQATQAQPTFVADVAGTYVVQLIVNDGQVDSTPATVTITTMNQVPVANAGDDVNVETGQLVTLNGSDSFDPDQDTLFFSWMFIQVPPGSLIDEASLNNPTSPQPSFTPDVDGDYVIELEVSDPEGLSDTDQVTVQARTPNVPPNARIAGPSDIPELVGIPVTLDGSPSDDGGDGPENLTFQWFFAEVPPNSALTDENIAGAETSSASFTPDVEGLYRVTLEVFDGIDSDQAEVRVDARENVGPIADAGADISDAIVGEPVTLDGSGSRDPDNGPEPLSYLWSFVMTPVGSELGDEDITNTEISSFTPDVAGEYLIRLDVSDGAGSSFDQVMVVSRSPLPDLIVSSFTTIGPAIGNEQNDIEVPIRAVIRNQGGTDADIFKVATEYTGPQGTFVAPFTVPGQSNFFYPFTDGPLPPDSEVAFEGIVTFSSSLRGTTVSLNAIADSCSGDEFMPDYCRVDESDENNNTSNSIELNIPMSPEPIISNIRQSGDTVNSDNCVASDGSQFSGGTFTIMFDYSDSDGDASLDAGATVQAFGSFDATPFSNFMGDGFAGVIESFLCHEALSDGISVDVTVTLTDGSGNISNSLTITIPPPAPEVGLSASQIPQNTRFGGLLPHKEK